MLHKQDQCVELYVRNSNLLIHRFRYIDRDFLYHVDTYKNEGERCFFSGWSLDPLYGLPAKAILLFDGQLLKKVVKSSVHRPDVAIVHSTFIDYLGFEDTTSETAGDVDMLFVTPDDKAFVCSLDAKECGTRT